jgi:hypothetical protein
MKMMTEKLLDMIIYGVMRRSAIADSEWIWEKEGRYLRLQQSGIRKNIDEMRR